MCIEDQAEDHLTAIGNHFLNEHSRAEPRLEVPIGRRERLRIRNIEQHSVALGLVEIPGRRLECDRVADLVRRIEYVF